MKAFDRRKQSRYMPAFFISKMINEKINTIIIYAIYCRKRNVLFEQKYSFLK